MTVSSPDVNFVMELVELCQAYTQDQKLIQLPPLGKIHWGTYCNTEIHEHSNVKIVPRRHKSTKPI